MHDPESMSAIDGALRQASIAPQWIDLLEPEAQRGVYRGGKRLPWVETQKFGYRPVLPPLREEDLSSLEDLEEYSLPLSCYEEQLLRRSIESLDYTGDWSDCNVKDSIVLCCARPQVVPCDNGMEYTCPYDGFTMERMQMHEKIVQRMLTSPRTWGRLARPQASTVRLAKHASPGTERAINDQAARVAAAARAAPLGSLRVNPSSSETHAFIVVGVPGSGKDTVIKRYLRTLGLPLLDASADLVKEYLAAWGQDELSKIVRKNNRENGPGKHLLHAQYLHRESILVNDQVVERALQQNRSLIIEKTLHDSDHVLSYARRLRESGCKVHLFGTLISPLKNWEFLRNRMISGQAFGRYITKRQAISSLRQYHRHFSHIVADPRLRRSFDSIHLFDVIENEWCVSITDTTQRYVDDPVDI